MSDESLPQSDLGREAGTDEPESHSLTRLTDLLPRKRKNVDEQSKYSPEFMASLQRPARDAIQCGEAPEYEAAVRAAYAATYYLKAAHPELQQDIVEESVAEALRLYVECPCGNIESTCGSCNPRSRGRGRSDSLVIPFNVEGLAKLTRRICERLKKQATRRELTLEQHGVEEADSEFVRLDWKDARQVEDDMVARLDAGRGYVDWANPRLVEFLRNTLTPAELISVRVTGRLTSDALARVRKKLDEALFQRQ